MGALDDPRGPREGEHQVDRGVAVIAGALTDLDKVSLIGLDQTATAASLVEIAAAEARLGELKHRVLAHASSVRVEEATGAATTATWLARATRTTVRSSRRAVHLAAALETYERLREGYAAGRVNTEQAEVIARALDALPADIPATVRAAAEQRLVDLAGHHDACDLRVLGDRVLDVVAPAVADAHEAARLEAEERAAARKTMLTMTPDGQGSVHGRFTVPELHAGMLRKQLLALVVHDKPALASTPATAAEQGEGERPEPVKAATAVELGAALCELLERLDGSQVPEMSTGATVVVTMTLETLTGGLAAATLDTGDRIAAHTARRLACEAAIIPVVLDGRREVLDVGRRKRLFTRAQRIALATRDKGGTAAGCHTAAWFCHAHHDQPWAAGGTTDLANGRLLCPTHHRRAHDDRYQTRVLANNQIEFTLRT
ncbi:HNH endonuclease signature motif containing protein [Nocardioides sp. REDSEA-S30_B4]|uniref:HNH endonuclease signature motif containing protein n=1 Tax=Nocardioides sp. REDSEA-S30_B4 TaxID=1811552 RepID=UPI000A6A7CC3|nr:HNH endonuclease signature motif containing protein [Nocardioides sp. REDSEA-S30_B4]